MRPCGHLFQIPTATRTAPCSCGRESIGQCIDCERPLCGLHGTGEAEFLCESCREGRVAQKRMRAEEVARDHEMGLVDVGGSLGPPGQGGRLPLRDVWIAVSAAIRAKDPPADIMVLDERRLEELPGPRRTARTPNGRRATDRPRTFPVRGRRSGRTARPSTRARKSRRRFVSLVGAHGVSPEI
jgi:hypothetical protein